MSDRYFSDTPITGNRAVLAGPEAHHLIHVMRARLGTQVTLLDGSGCEFPAVVERLGRAEVELAVLARHEIDRELSFTLTLGVALPKGERQRWLVEKAVELGVTRIVPLETARSVAQPGAAAIARLRRAVIEASKQCGRNRLMEIAAPQAWGEFVKAMGGVECRLLAHPTKGEGRGEKGEGPVQGTQYTVHSTQHVVEGAGESPGPATPYSIRCTPYSVLCTAHSAVALAIGPEGGCTDEEVGLALAAGWQLVDLGPRILRVETAAILLVAICCAKPT